MMQISELFFLIVLSGISFYLGYRNSIESKNQIQGDEEYTELNEEDDIEIGTQQPIENKNEQINQFKEKQKELDSLNAQLREFKQREKKYLAEYEILKVRTEAEVKMNKYE